MLILTNRTKHSIQSWQIKHGWMTVFVYEAGTHCASVWVIHSAGLDGCGKSRSPQEFDPRTVWPVASLYTDYAIPTHDPNAFNNKIRLPLPGIETFLNNINNQQDATNFPCINLFKSAQHVSGENSPILRSTFLTVYTAFGTMHRLCCRSVPRLK